MLQVASGFAALAVGCDGGSDDDSGSGTDGTGSTSTSGSSSGSGNGSSSSTGSDETTDGTTDTTTGEPGTSSSTGGADTGSSSGGEGSSSGSSSGGEASLCTEGTIVAVISMNHGHALEIPLADIEAGVETTYDATGTAGHCHEVVVTAEDFANLRAGLTVIKYSCNGGDHEYALSCVKGGDQPGNPAEECAMDPQFGSC